MKSNKILVCIDFNEQSLVALHQCYDLARFVKAEVVLLYVIESTDFFSKLFSTNTEKVKEEILNRLNIIVEKECAASNLKFSYTVKEGKVHEQIIQTAKEINARFIIMGKNGSTQGFRKFLGSNTTKVISESDFPVISIKGKHSIGYKNIVLPIDLTKSTREIVASAISFSRFFGSHMHIVSVHNVGLIFKATSLYNRVKKIERELHSNGVECSHKFIRREKLPDYEYVLKHAEEVNADLIMIMTHQEGKARDYYIGAFAHHIINESEIPVLSLTPMVDEAEESVVEAIVDPFNLF